MANSQLFGSQSGQVVIGMFGTAQRVDKLKQCASVPVAGVQITLSDHVKSLRVTFNLHLSFDKHVNKICSACYFHIRGLLHVRSAMSTYNAKTVACAIVSSRLDYCNALLASMSESNLDKLQRVPKHPRPCSHWISYRRTHYTGPQGAALANDPSQNNVQS